MIQEKNWYRAIVKVSDVMNKIINFLCVVMLTVQTVSILIMVFGRYLFNSVPKWSEQLALFCMIWFALFSIALSIRDDSHVKMEVIDNLVSQEVLMGFKVFGVLCNIVFGLVMVVYGTKLSLLTWPTLLSALRISIGLQYFSAVVGGLFIIINAVLFCIEMFVKHHDEKLLGEEDVV